ncbi:MAG TPA: phosphate butyryltransferase [Bacillota bacterium]|nr:phosphate butyryltransferase [Bacillota bacterium]
MKSFAEVLKSARERGPKTIAVAVAQDADVLAAVSRAHREGIANSILVGNKEEILNIAAQQGIDIEGFEIMDEPDKATACQRAVELVSSGRADIVMKGLVDTSIILKAVLADESLRGQNVLSHVGVAEVNGYDRLLMFSDAAMIIAPDLGQKVQILENAVKAARALDIISPKVAIVCAVEKVNPKMPATLDAQELVKMNQEGRIKDCMVGGPFALDNAVSVEAAKHKGIDHPVAGKADVLIVPDIEAGNILYKSFVYFARAKNAGVIVGAKVPIVLTSRADNEEAKLNSIALAVLMANK